MIPKLFGVIAVLTVVVAPTFTVDASEPFLGEIKIVGFGFAPRGFAECNGQVLQINQNTALFSLLGTTFGGDGRTSFGLPDLRGRTAVHVGSGPGLANSVVWGQKGGAQTRTLTLSNMPSHNHDATLHATSTDGNETGPSGHILANDPREDQYSDATPNVTLSTASITTASQGGGSAVDIRDPYLGVYHVIATQGTFPSRN